MPTHSKLLTAYCQSAFYSSLCFSIKHTCTLCSFLDYKKEAFATHSQKKKKSWKALQNPIYSILKYCNVSRTMKALPVSHRSSLIQCVFKISWKHQCLSQWHTRFNVCICIWLHSGLWILTTVFTSSCLHESVLFLTSRCSCLGLSLILLFYVPDFEFSGPEDTWVII